MKIKSKTNLKVGETYLLPMLTPKDLRQLSKKIHEELIFNIPIGSFPDIPLRKLRRKLLKAVKQWITDLNLDLN